MKTYTIKNNYDDRELQFEALYYTLSKGERHFEFYTYDKEKNEVVTIVIPTGSWLLWNTQEK